MSKKNTGPFVSQISLDLAEQLKIDLKEQGFELKKPDYTVFAARKKGVSCTLYESGKLVVQGKDKDEFIEFYLEPQILEDFSYSHGDSLIEEKLDLTPHCGVDEAGKGDYFGSLCVAGVYADSEQIKKLSSIGIMDSKVIKDPKIRPLAKEIVSICPYHLVKISPEKYNELYPRFNNLNRLLAWGHATVIENLVKQTGATNVLVDQFGSKSLVADALSRKGVSIHLDQRPRAEEDVVVAAASIIARAAFLRSIQDLEEQFSFTFPKGAGSPVTKAGKKFLSQFGKEQLGKAAKLHFKTTEGLLQD
ncbi:MAG: ribonuclease HIII [Waddliaceae bacterium]|nr:ribonuclease HIII [Waddliaceae bacterium]